MESFAILSGYVTNDPEVKQITTGKTIINFSLSVYDPFKKDGDRRWVSFIDCEYWPKEAPEGNVEREIEKIVKGALLNLKARPIQDRWEQDGQKRSKIKFIVDGWPDSVHHHQKPGNASSQTEEDEILF